MYTGKHSINVHFPLSLPFTDETVKIEMPRNCLCIQILSPLDNMLVSRHRYYHSCSVHVCLSLTEHLRETNGKSIYRAFRCHLLKGKPEPSREGRCPGCHCADSNTVEGPRFLVFLHPLEAWNWMEPELLDSIGFSDFSDDCSIFIHHLYH